MGVPKFFKWILDIDENDVLINTIINEGNISLYIDANCLFHPICFETLEKYNKITHVDILEKKMFKNIIKYIDFLITFTKATFVYISVDGVCPFAKINQQRKRRYMSICDKKNMDKINNKYNKPINSIWSNTCISPGTEFMEKLHIEIINYINNKKIKILYSSYHQPGEGEHKILQYIKQNDKDEISIIYGLDADLIFLAMVSEKNKIYLLRERNQIKQNKENNSKPQNQNLPIINNSKQNLLIEEKIEKIEKIEIKESENNFLYVNIDILKIKINTIMNNFINNNYKQYKTKINDENIKTDIKNLENFINDFVFICFLLGNDFMPHLPSLNISTDGLYTLLKIYANIFNNYKEFIILKNDDQVFINNKFLVQIFKKLSEIEKKYFEITLPTYLNRLSRKKCISTDDYLIEIFNYNNVSDKEANILKNDTNIIKFNNQYKYKYYEKYFKQKNNELIEITTKSYLKILKWTSIYYFRRCDNWLEQYEFNHCPMVSDIYKYITKNNININDIQIMESIILEPFQQLLSILPPQQANLLPKEFNWLMTQESDIIDLFPIEISLDTMNKEYRYLCVPNLPIVDPERILNVTKKIKIQQKDKIRNTRQELIINN